MGEIGRRGVNELPVVLPGLHHVMNRRKWSFQVGQITGGKRPIFYFAVGKMSASESGVCFFPGLVGRIKECM